MLRATLVVLVLAVGAGAGFVLGRYGTLEPCAIYAMDLERYVEREIGAGRLGAALAAPLIENGVAGLDAEGCLRLLYRLHFTDQPFEGVTIRVR